MPAVLIVLVLGSVFVWHEHSSSSSSSSGSSSSGSSSNSGSSSSDPVSEIVRDVACATNCGAPTNGGCDLSNGICVCCPGWTGSDCLTAVNECSAANACNGGSCSVPSSCSATYRVTCDCATVTGFYFNTTSGNCTAPCRSECATCTVRFCTFSLSLSLSLALSVSLCVSVCLFVGG